MMIKHAAQAAGLAALLLTPSAAAENDCKVDVCHYPPGNPGNAHVISISVSALETHLGHGDSMAFDGYCYVFVPEPSLSADAEDACVNDYGGHLASIHSQEEDDYISHLVDPAAVGGITAHIGGLAPAGFCAGSGAIYDWTDGTDWDFSNWRLGTSEPNCSGGGTAGAVQFWPNTNGALSGWNDVRADRAMLGGYVCKFGGRAK